MSAIRFPQTQIYDIVDLIVAFSAYVGTKRLRCAISLDALRDHFQANLLTPLQAFICSRHEIERIAERLITNQRFEDDGSVLIRSEDCLM